MQINLKAYTPKKHEKFNALAIEQPEATNIILEKRKFIILDEDIEISNNLLLCSTHIPNIYGLECGATLAFLYIDYIKKGKDLIKMEKEKIGVDFFKEDKFSNKTVIFIKEIKRVVEMPFSGSLGFQIVTYDKGDILEYPKAIHFDVEDLNFLYLENEKNRTKN